MRRALLVLAVLALLAAIPAFTAGIPVPATYASETSSPVAPNDLKPFDCAAVDLTTINVGTSGGPGNDLVLGSASGETVRGMGGDDCVMGGGGNDTVRGDAGYDICIGGPGTDSFHPSCEATVQ